MADSIVIPVPTAVYVDPPAAQQADRVVAATDPDVGLPWYSSFNAAIAAASAGDVIEGRATTPGGTFSDNTAVTANVNGSSGSLIVVRGRAGDTIKITGQSGGENVRINGDYIDFGENILLEGDASPDQSNVNNAVYVTGNNNIVRSNMTRANTHSLFVVGGSNTVIRDGYQYIIGTLEKTGGGDGGDGIEQQTTGALTVYKRVGACGGHGLLGQQNTGNTWASFVRGENLWDQEDDRLHPGITTDGNRVQTWAESFDTGVLQNFVYGPIGQPYDTAAVQILRLAGKDIRCRYGLLIGNRSGGMGLQTNLPNGDAYGADGLYVCYLTITNNDGPAVSISGPAESSGTTYQNLNYYNCLFWNNRLNPQTANKEDHDFYAETDNGVPGRSPEELFSIVNCAFPVGAKIRFKDVTDGNRDITVAQLNAFPNCSGNIEITDPLFVDDTIPRVARPVSAWDDTMISTPYANFRPTNGAVLGAGRHLTNVNGAVSGSSTVTVDDAGWFQAGDFSGTIPGDTIFIEGYGVATIAGISGDDIVVNETIDCDDGAQVYLGNSASPNIGWYQQSGLYG